MSALPSGAPAPSDPLADLGFDEERAYSFVPHAQQGLEPARVARVDRGACGVITRHGALRAALSPALARREGEESVAVGDWVGVRVDVDPPRAEAVLERTTAFVRKAAGRRVEAQVFGANVDIALVVDPLDAGPSPRRLERLLALAWESGATPVVALTKSDLADDLARVLAQVAPVTVGVELHLVSATTGDGLEPLRALLGPGITLVLLGPSGAGKSTLVNALVGEDVMETGEVRSDGRGRHTTTHRELIPLPGGGALLDTPGIREVGLWDAAEGLSLAFADVEAAAGECRFRDCTHNGEPGCGVDAAVASGDLEAERVDAWFRLQREEAWMERRANARLRSEARRQYRSLSMQQRAHQKSKRG